MPLRPGLVPPVPGGASNGTRLDVAVVHGPLAVDAGFSHAEPVSQGQDKSIRLPMVKGSAAVGVTFGGFFHAPENGEYNFTLESDTGAMLFLHDIRVIDEPMKDAAGKFSGSVWLKAGWHPVRVYYRHEGGRKLKLELACQKPDGTTLKLDEESLRQAAVKD